VSADRAVIEPLHRLSRPCPELVDIGAFRSSFYLFYVFISEGRAHIFKVSIAIIYIKEFRAILTIKGLYAFALGIPYDFFSWAKRVPR
jgi:hypothetical protein